MDDEETIKIVPQEQEMIIEALTHYFAEVMRQIESPNTLQCVRLALYRERGKLRDLLTKLGDEP